MKNGNKVMAILISLIMVVSCMAGTTFGSVDSNVTEEVAAVAEPEETSFQVLVGTDLEDIGLPEAITAVVKTVRDGAEVSQEERTLDVNWQGNYTSEAAGKYQLTADFKDEITIAGDVVMPTVEVEVLEASDPPEIKTLENDLATEDAGGGTGDGTGKDQESEFDPFKYSASEYSMDEWPGYKEYKEFFDAMPSVEEVSKYEIGSDEIKQLEADMEKARELAKAVEDFTIKMQDRDMFQKAYEERVEEDIKRAEEEGWDLSEEEKEEYRNSIPQMVDWAVESWKRAQEELVPEKIYNPMEVLFEKYKWYTEKKDSATVVTKPHFALVSVPSGANANLSKPEDFEIGKRGQENFTIAVTVDFNGFTNVEGLSGKTAILKLPAGISFVADTFTASSTGETYKFTPEGNGKQELMITFPDSFTGKFYQTFLVEQNAKDLINDLKKSKGNIDFDLDVYTGYRTDSQKQVVSQDGQIHSSTLRFTADSTTPAVNITITKGNIDDIYYPKDVKYSESFDADRECNRYTPGATYIVELQKEKGYLSDDFAMNFNLPGVDEGVFLPTPAVRGNLYFTGEDGVKREFYSYSKERPEDNMLLLNIATSSNYKRNEGFAYIENTTSTFAQTLYGKGTITIEIETQVYINRVYSGDWTDTLYTSGKNIEAYGMNYEKAELEKTESKAPLYFNFQNGDKVVGFNEKMEGLQAEMPQYGKISRYEDSDWIGVRGHLSEDNSSEKGFAFYDNISHTLEFSQELSPIALNKLKPKKNYGISYRIYITNAATGKVERIETIVGEEEYGTYQAKTIDGVQETLFDGTDISEWNLEGANDKGNTYYVSKVEQFRAEFEFNYVFRYDYSDWPMYQMKLRAQHHKLSDGTTDVPDNFETTIKSRLTSTNPEIDFQKEYKVKLRHLRDSITLADNKICDKYVMEVNNHNESGRYFSYSVVKYADTQKYNTNDEGEDIKFGEEGYDPIVVELSGDVVTVTDRLEETDQRILGVWGDDGKYYDLGEMGINADDYLVETAAVMDKDNFDREIYNIGNNHGNLYRYDVKTFPCLYDLAAIYKELGINYAEKLVVALSNVNDKPVAAGSNKAQIDYNVAIHNVYPGYLNYDNVIGIKNSTDKNVKLTGSVNLFCKYSDYLNSHRDGNPHGDTTDPENGKNYHGEEPTVAISASAITYGQYASKVNYVTDSTQYVKPMAYFWEGSGYNYECTELIRFEVTPERIYSAQMDYSAVTYDLTGTDPRLLALTNTIAFTGSNIQNVILEYTLSDGTSVKTEKNFEIAKKDSNWGIYYTLPELCEADPYGWGNPKALSLTQKHLTSLKITFPDGINWGNNYDKGDRNQRLPDIALGLKDAVIPEYYPNDTTQKIGTMSHDDATGLDYDNLKGKLSVFFGDVMGNEIAKGEGDCQAEGLSKRIGVPRIYATDLYSFVAYDEHYWGESTSVYQNEEIAVQDDPGFSLRDSTNLNDDKVDTGKMMKMLEQYGVKIRPTFYYVIDKGFSYVPDSFYATLGYNNTQYDTGIQARYIDSYEDGKGLLIVSYDETDDDNHFFAKHPQAYDSSDYTRKYFHFKLRAKYDAPVGTTKPIETVWMDVPFNRNLDGSYDIKGQLASVDTAKTTPGAPYGEEVGNVGKINPNKDGQWEMLKYDESKRALPTVSVQEKVFTGMLNFVKTYAPEAEDDFKVSAKDILAEENIYGYKSFLTGDTKEPTHDWELYTVIPKKDETFSYYNEENKLSVSKSGDFSLVFNGVDVSKLEEEKVAYKLYYTTDENPADNGYESMKAANWTEFTPDDPDSIDALKVTGIKLWVEELQSKQKISLETKYRLENHKEKTGEEVSYVMSYVNFKMGTKESREEAQAGGDKGYSDLSPLEYHLEDMNITGYAWIEDDYNSMYNEDNDSMYKGVSFKVFDEEGNEIAQPETMKEKTVSGKDGKYEVVVPHDGKWQLEAKAPEGIGFVKKLVNGDKTLESSFDRNTKKTDIIEFVSDYRTLNFTQSNVNVGVYVAPTIDYPEAVEIQVGKEDEGEFEVTVENRVPDTVSTIELKDGENESVTTINDGGDDTATFDGNTTGKITGKVSIDDGYGGTVEGEFKVTVYSKVEYDITNRIAEKPVSATSGKTPVDDNHYYPSVGTDGNDLYTDLATTRNDGEFSSTGYVFTGWATSEEDAINGIAAYKPNQQVKIGSADSDLTLYAVWKKCNPVMADPPVKKVITGEKPKEDTLFTFVLKAQRNTAGFDTMPMPEGANGQQSMISTILGAGSTEFGNIMFTFPGVYEYTITEEDGGLENYTYDKSVYLVRYTVTQNGEALEVERTITKNGKESDDVVFANKYTRTEVKSSDYIDKPDDKGGDTKKDKNQPDTGDRSDSMFWMILCEVSLVLAGIMSILVKRKKTENTETAAGK